MTVTIEVPLPLNGTQKNNRKHWRKVSDAVKTARTEGMVAAHGKPRLTAPIRVDHEWFFGQNKAEIRFKAGGVPPSMRAYRPRDEANAIGALAGSIDGIVDAKVLPGDTAKQLNWGECKINSTMKQHKGRSCVLLTFTELEEG